MFVKKKAKQLKKVDLDVDDRLVEVGFKVSNKDRERLREEAFRKKISQGSIMRKVLKNHFEDEVKRRKELGPKLEVILDSCVGWFGGFEIEGKEGFIERMYNSGFRLDELNNDQWDRVKKSLQIGYNGYGQGLMDQDIPSPDEFVKKFDPLKPTDNQRSRLRIIAGWVEEAFEGEVEGEGDLEEESEEEEGEKEEEVLEE